MRIVLDIETTYQSISAKKSNPSPYHKDNKLVSVGWLDVATGYQEYLYFHHNKLTAESTADSWRRLQEILSKTTLIIGHNLKFDMSWLYECGFTYDGSLYDTMIFEYVVAKAQKPDLKLEKCAVKYGLPEKLDWFKEQMALGINTDDMELGGLTEYGLQDLDTTRALWEFQCNSAMENQEIQQMQPAIQLMNDTLDVIIEMERNGCYINLNVLDEVEREYREEFNTLQTGLQNIVANVMGDTPINLESSEHLSWIIYSRKVKSKELWAESFGIGSEERGAVKKAKKPRLLKPDHFRKLILSQMETLYKTEAYQCPTCIGRGKIRKIRKNGTEYKNENYCPDCAGTGIQYKTLEQIAGFKIKPIDSTYATQAGFSTDKYTLEDMLKKPKLKDEARDFIEGYMRWNAVGSYLSTFIAGIKKYTHDDNILHTTLNMCITATARLSSTNPNFHNLPRAKTFPVRKCVESRFKGGKILEVDWASLEYRVGILLSRDKAGIASCAKGEDRHTITAKIIYDVTPDHPTFKVFRQNAKAHTFKPLYGGTSGTEAEQAYYQVFKEEHKDLVAWQKDLAVQAIHKHQIQSPSGRIFAFPNARRINAEYVVGQTQIYNYLIQSFATGDITPCVLVDLHKRMKGLKSKLILTVHDSVEIDVHPEEIDLIPGIVHDSFSNIKNILQQRFGFECCVDLPFEISMGDNWMEKTELHINKD